MAVPAERILTLDAVRGFAVMAILSVNIFSFAMPDVSFLSPELRAPQGAGDEFLWVIAFLFADGKFRGLFTLLFGASMMLVMDRAAAAGLSARHIHGRRMFWLALIGLGHYLLIWHGDILLTYAIMGLLLSAVHGWPPKRLIGVGVMALLLCALWISWIEAGNLPLIVQLISPAPHQAALAQIKAMHAAEWQNIDQSIAEDIRLFTGSYGEILQGRFGKFGDYLFSLPIAAMETLPMMMIGAGLYRIGFLSGEWPKARYQRLLRWALPLGLLLTALPAAVIVASDFDPLLSISAHLGWSVPGRLLLVISYAALLILWVNRFNLWMTHDPTVQFVLRLTSAGRMALTNYLLSSVLMTSIFYGYGLGLFAQLSALPLYAITYGTCIAMLLWSPWWMSRFHYGPAEWLWRSLARGQRQPFKRG